MGDGDDHVLALDQVLDVLVELALLEHRTTVVGEAAAHRHQLGPQECAQHLTRGQDLEIPGDARHHLVELVGDLAALERRQAVEAQIEDGSRLDVGEAVATVLDLVPGLVDQRDQGGHVARRPGLGHERLARRRRVLRGADGGDDRVHVGDRDGEADQDVRPLPRALELVRRAPGDDLFAEGHEGDDDVAQVHGHGPAAVEGQHIDAEGALERGVAVELVEHHVGVGVAAQLDDDPHPISVRFVAQVGDALDRAVLHHLGDALHEAGLVELVRNLGEDDGFPVATDALDHGARAHGDRAAPALVGAFDAAAAEDDGARGEVRARHMLHQARDRDLRIVDIGAAGVDHLTQVVGRDVGRHADRDAARAVDQQVRELGREDLGLLRALVVVGLEIDRLAVDIGEERLRRFGHARLGVAHGGRRGRRPRSRNCPAPRSGGGAWRRAGPCAPWRRRWPNRRGDGTCP